MQRSKNDLWVGLFVLIGAAAILFLALKSANLLNLNFNWKDIGGQPIDLALFATNVTNKNYYVAATNGITSLGAEFVVLGEPRMFGARIKFRFGN